MRKRTIYSIIVIIALGFLLRFVHAGVNFFDDEVDWLVLVNSVSISKNCMILPLSGTGHGPLAIYLTKLSGLLFGETELGYRFIIVVFNTCMIWLIFLLTKVSLGDRAGLFAAFLAAINSFLIYYSREIGCDGYFLFISVAVIYSFFMAMESKKDFYMYLFGISVGFALLDKITILFLFPGFSLYLLIDKERREWFRKPSFYWSLLICFVLVSPYLYWLGTNEWSHFRINSGYIKFFNFPLALSVFLGSILRDGASVHMHSFGREHMSLGMGLLLISGVIFTVQKARNNHLIQLMHFLFWGIICISILFFRGWAVNFNVCILPAIILTAAFLDSLWDKRRLIKVLIVTISLIHMLYMPQYLGRIKKSYDYHSALSTTSEKIPSNVNLNIISSSLVPLVMKYKPTLVVTPNPQWDTIACYLGAQTGIKTLAPVPLIYDSVKYNKSDWERILIIDDDWNAVSPYVNWANSSDVYVSLTKQEYLRFNMNNKPVSLPVAAVLLSFNETGISSEKTLDGFEIEGFIRSSLR